VCFVDRCLSFCNFSFGHCVVCSSSIYGFWLPLWYLQTLHIILGTCILADKLWTLILIYFMCLYMTEVHINIKIHFFFKENNVTNVEISNKLWLPWIISYLDLFPSVNYKMFHHYKEIRPQAIYGNYNFPCLQSTIIHCLMMKPCSSLLIYMFCCHLSWNNIFFCAYFRINSMSRKAHAQPWVTDDDFKGLIEWQFYLTLTLFLYPK